MQGTLAFIREQFVEARLAAHEALGARGVAPVTRHSAWFTDAGVVLPRPAPASVPAERHAHAARVAGELGLPAPRACSDMSGVWTTFAAGEWILRIPAVADPLMCARLELAGRLDARWSPRDVTAAPDGTWVLERRLPGVPLVDAWTSMTALERVRLAGELREARSVLAAMPAPAWMLESSAAHVTSRVSSRMTGIDPDAVVALLCADTTLRHGDLHAGNLLVRDGYLTGIVDWEHLCCGVHERDLAIVQLALAAQTSPEFAAAVTPEEPDLFLHVLALAILLTPRAVDPATLPPARRVMRDRMTELVAAVLAIAPPGGVFAAAA